jgi:hypothetical protein
MSQAKLEITGDTQHAQRENDKLTKQVAKLREEVRQLGQQSKKSAKESHDAFSAAGSNLAKTITGMVTVEAGVSAVVGLYSNWRAEVDKLTAAHDKLTANIVKTAAATGNLGRGADLERFVKGQRGVTREQATEAFLGVAGAGVDMSFERKAAIAGLVAKQAPTGVKLQEAGSLAGDLGELFGDKSAGDVVDLATKSRAMAGDKAQQLGSDEFMRAMRGMVSAGMTPEQAMGRALGALDNDQNLKQFTALGSALTAGQGTYGQDRKDTAAEKAFDKATPQERIKMLENDPALARKVLGGTGGFKLQQSDGGGLEARVSALKDAQTENFAQQQLGQLGTFESGREALEEQEIAAAKDPQDASIGARGSRLNRTRKKLQTAAVEQFGEAGRLYGQALEPLPYLNQGIGEVGDDTIALFRTVGEGILQLTGHMKKVEENTRPPPAKVNIDAHTE